MAKEIFNNVNRSYWEIDQYFKMFDMIVVGGGIVGLSTALSLRKRKPTARILVIERGLMPEGASTKNAGFACFGSPSELLDDLSKMNERTVWETVQMRWKGLELLKRRLGAKNIDLQMNGGFELFDSVKEFETCAGQISYLNKMAAEVIGKKNTYTISSAKTKHFGGISASILNSYEGQIDTGKMMRALKLMCHQQNIEILYGINVRKIQDTGSGAEILTDLGVLRSRKLIVATNGFAGALLKIKDVKPARAQVLITKPIKNLKIKGTFHYQQGYYYFRNIHNRILFGGGRNLDLKTETSTEMAFNPLIQKKLDQLLKEMILPGLAYEVEQRWTGIMGVGSEKKPIIEHYTNNIIAAVRMGGMGVAIGSLVGEQAAIKALE